MASLQKPTSSTKYLYGNSQDSGKPQQSWKPRKSRGVTFLNDKKIWKFRTVVQDREQCIQITGIENPEVNFHIQVGLIFNKLPEQFNREKTI